MDKKQLDEFITKAASAASFALRIKDKGFANITPEDIGVLCGQTYGMAMAVTVLCSTILTERLHKAESKN